MIADSPFAGERFPTAWKQWLRPQTKDEYQDHMAAFDHLARIKSMLSPPQAYSSKLSRGCRERIGELNLTLRTRNERKQKAEAERKKRRQKTGGLSRFGHFHFPFVNLGQKLGESASIRK